MLCCSVYRYVVKLLDFFDFHGQIFIVCNFLCLNVGKVTNQGNCYIKSAVLFFLSMSTVSGLLKSTVLSVIIVYIIIIQYVCLLSQAFLPGTSLEPAVIPTAQTSSFTLQYFPYYV